MREAIVLILALAVSGPAQAQRWSTHGQEWPQVDCARSHVIVPGQQLCRQGPLAGVNTAYSNNTCAFEQWYAYAQPPASHGAAQVFMLQPGTGPQCWVNKFSDPDAALTAFSAIREAGARSPLVETDGLLSANFTSKAQEQCGAFIKYGPRWQGGHTYYLRGFLCAHAGSPLNPGDLRKFVDAIVVNTG